MSTIIYDATIIEAPVAGRARTPDRTLSAEPGGGNPHLSAGNT